MPVVAKFDPRGYISLNCQQHFLTQQNQEHHQKKKQLTQNEFIHVAGCGCPSQSCYPQTHSSLCTIQLLGFFSRLLPCQLASACVWPLGTQARELEEVAREGPGYFSSSLSVSLPWIYLCPQLHLLSKTVSIHQRLYTQELTQARIKLCYGSFQRLCSLPHEVFFERMCDLGLSANTPL